MLASLKKRLDSLNQRNQDLRAKAQDRLAYQAQVKAQARLMRQMLADPRYEHYRALLLEAKQLFEHKRHLDCLTESSNPSGLALRTAKYSGHIEMLNWIIGLPEEVLRTESALLAEGEPLPEPEREQEA